jgi:hypothetical protein
MLAEVVEDQPHTAARLRVLVHHEPDAQTEPESVAQDWREAFALRNADLAEPETKAGFQCRVLAEITVAAEGEEVARDRQGRLTASKMVGAEVLPAALASFREEHPRIDIELVLSIMVRRKWDAGVKGFFAGLKGRVEHAASSS